MFKKADRVVRTSKGEYGIVDKYSDSQIFKSTMASVIWVGNFVEKASNCKRDYTIIGYEIIGKGYKQLT